VKNDGIEENVIKLFRDHEGCSWRCVTYISNFF